MTPIILSGNCFWVLQAVFEPIKGISNIECGYIWMEAGVPVRTSTIPWPVTQMEVIRCTWDPEVLSVEDLVRVLLHCTSAGLVSWDYISELSGMRSLLAQIPDEFHDRCAATVAELAAQQQTPLHTQIVSQTLNFRKAGEMDQRFFEDYPQDQYSCGIITPKLNKIKTLFPHLLHS